MAGMVVGGMLGQQGQAAEALPGLAPESAAYAAYLDHSTQRVIIDAPFINQREEYPTGCESVSAVMALQYAGLEVGVEDFLTHLKMAGEPWPDSQGQYHAADPREAYLGDPRGQNGWGCYAPAVKKAAEGLLAEKGSGLKVRDLTGSSLDQLWQSYVSRGTPVVVWATMYMEDAALEATLHLENGGTLDWLSPEHCLLLVGADSENYYFNDPLEGKAVAYPRDSTERAYQALGEQALVIE